MKYIKANDRDSFSIPGNQILPKTAVISIFHTLSGEPSRFEVDLGGKLIPMPQPRQLPRQYIFLGSDAIGFIDRAAQIARQSDPDICLVAAFPADNTVYIDSTSRLKYTEVKNWIATFYSPRLDRVFTAIERKDRIEMHNSKRQLSDPDFPTQPISGPLVGNQRALEIATDRNLLSADWKDGPRLESIKVDGAWRLAWSLPYRGSDALPIIVDSGNGNLIKMQSGGFISIPTGTSTTEEPAHPTPDPRPELSNSLSETSDEPPLISTWLSSEEEFGQYGSYPVYSCEPWIIGNPPGGSPLQFDLIKIDFLHGTKNPDDVSASIFYFSNSVSSPELGPGMKRIMRNFFGDTPFSLQNEDKREMITIEPNRQLELHFMQLQTFSGPIRISLFKGDQEILTSKVVELPEWKSLPSTDQLYWMGKEKHLGEKGVELIVPLHRQ